MKYILTLLLLTTASQVVLSQELESIVVRVEHADEPPTKYGPQIFEISFTADEQRNFVANTYTNKYKRKKRINLKNPAIIKAAEGQKFNDWNSTSKANFSLSELGIGIDELNQANSTYKPDFQIKKSTIHIDSFKICKDWQFERSISYGGYSIDIDLIYDSKPTEFIKLDSHIFGNNKFDLQSYLLIQPLLKESIPQEFRIQGFFDKEVLIDVLNYYFKVIECEGYYYNEFIEQNPERTPKENRMMIGWDFEKHLKGRSENHSNLSD